MQQIARGISYERIIMFRAALSFAASYHPIPPILHQLLLKIGRSSE